MEVTNKKNDLTSRFDPTRKTVGAIYNDAQIEGEKHVEVGDMTRELMSSLVVDLHETIDSQPHPGKEYYILIHEKKDLQMPRAIHRKIVAMPFRPYPEDDTIVFKVSPVDEVSFCWCLPHSSEMQNMVNNEELFDKNMIEQVKAYFRVDLWHFGFRKDMMGNWEVNPHFIDKKLDEFSYRGPKIIVPVFN